MKRSWMITIGLFIVGVILHYFLTLHILVPILFLIGLKVYNDMSRRKKVDLDKEVGNDSDD